MAKCFIITPYGTRPDAAGNTINFDDVFDKLVEPAVIEAGLEPVRSDRDLEAGPIFKKMIQDIATADVCIADITTLNPNVFYELGVRHALCRGVTVLIRLVGQPLPFDIQDLRVFAYGPMNASEVGASSDSARFAAARGQIVKAIAHARNQKEADSLVFHALPDLSVAVQKPRPITSVTKTRFALKDNRKRHVGLIGGNLADVRGVSVWVNSENTDMQMSRYYEPTVSGTIRYHGAKKGADGRVKDDLLADDLAAWMRKHKHTSVLPGTVIRTIPGELTKYGVKFVLHVAAVHATPGRGYHPVNDLRGCVTNVLRKLDEQKQSDFGRGRPSILLPLLGTGAGGGKVEDVVPQLFDAALDYLERTPDSKIEKVWFLAYSDQHWNACMKAISALTYRLQPAVRER
jgi:O-acetyl-ADP-ribose deacetylase (regulator of RNase III)